MAWTMQRAMMGRPRALDEWHLMAADSFLFYCFHLSSLSRVSVSVCWARKLRPTVSCVAHLLLIRRPPFGAGSHPMSRLPTQTRAHRPLTFVRIRACYLHKAFRLIVQLPGKKTSFIFIVDDCILCGYVALLRLTPSIRLCYNPYLPRDCSRSPSRKYPTREYIEQYMIQSRHRYSVIRLYYRCDDKQRRIQTLVS
ncbi:hypothetical protein B0H21DRAFT_566623 [Amylocystis lapponica]|nr:hypothetical protein B0H21DRAFT_566623 [Amylocystis lapponica]